jgi:hypothetical protein
LYDIQVSGNRNANTDSSASLGEAYVNDTGMDGKTFFIGRYGFRVKEIEVFKIINYRMNAEFDIQPHRIQDDFV